jgi:predicted secreted protein
MGCMARLLSVLVMPLACAACRHDAAPTPSPSSPATASAPPADAGETVVGLTDDGKTIDVPRGATVTVKLELSSGTGYSWVPASVDGGALAQQGERASEQLDAGPMPGGPRLDVYHFAARTPGVFTLAMELRRPWETDAPAARGFHVTVRVR